jgi:DHA1 family multidrug resistance protein-like MFS transporter
VNRPTGGVCASQRCWSIRGGKAGFVVLLLANTYPTILLATGLFILSKTFLRTALLSLASRRTTVGQGVAMGLGNSFISLGRIAGPVWAGSIFDANVSYPYLSGPAIMFAGFVVSLVRVSEGRTGGNVVLDADPRGFPQIR